MKRKFSFNLAPVKVPAKDSHAKQTPEPTPSHSHAHHNRSYSDHSLLSLNSPYISRRPLSPKTEQELRAACAVILQNFKPSDHELADKDPKLDFQGLDRRREQRSDKSAATQVRVRKPTGAPVYMPSARDAKTSSRNPDAAVKSHPDLPTRANTGRRRAEPAPVADRDQEARRTMKAASSDVPRSATMRSELDSDDGKSLATPLTGSTDAHLNNGSTAATTAAFTSFRSSKRASHQFESVAAVADAEAAEWMRHEVEKRRQLMASQPQFEPHALARPPSRARSIRSDLKDYIFPASAGLSRSQSRDSIRTANSTTSAPKELKRTPSSHGWRSWGLQRKFSSRTSSRPTTSKGRMENQDQSGKNSVNLNRDLPPLPSLDSWKQPEPPQQPKPQDNRKSQIQNAHIASLMRPQDQQQQTYAAAVRRHHRRSGSDTLAMRYTNPGYAQAPAQVARTASRSQTQLQRPAPKKEASMDFDEMMSSMSSTRNLDGQLALRINNQEPDQGKPSLSRSPSMKNGEGRLEVPPNFSRKISTDLPSSQRAAFPNSVEVGPTPKVNQKSRLKKVFSGWMLRKEKKDGDWMQKIEKQGVKGGIMVQDESALPPVVRY
ncbi:hypothetical protein BDV95DRAFT_315019 [Massariosphaeria phaeospora]|uniref:Uncharacterized protein n=1 Tax=Massariosphaeria phaeospora TaxID=100035 RepID=A0A7C8MCT4_9PLEO|nr:hypothetical protein BDV95DRAFT_315019 [Massariosphaeria phaeospora]